MFLSQFFNNKNKSVFDRQSTSDTKLFFTVWDVFANCATAYGLLCFYLSSGSNPRVEVERSLRPQASQLKKAFKG